MSWFSFLNNIRNNKKISNKYVNEDLDRELFVKCAGNGNLNGIVQLLINGIDVNLPNKDGHTALMMASQNGKLKVVNMLLNCKEIDVYAQNEDRNTALEMASENGHLDVVNKLLNFQIMKMEKSRPFRKLWLLSSSVRYLTPHNMQM